MKKLMLAILLITIIFSGLFFVLETRAQGFQDGLYQQLDIAVEGAEFTKDGVTTRDPRIIIAYMIQVVLGLCGIIATAYLVYAGALMIFSGGNDEKMKKGRHIILYAGIGMAIILSAYGIAILVNNMLTGQSSNQKANYGGIDVEIKPDYSQHYINDPLY